VEKSGTLENTVWDRVLENFAPPPTLLPILNALLQGITKNTEFFRDILTAEILNSNYI